MAFPRGRQWSGWALAKIRTAVREVHKPRRERDEREEPPRRATSNGESRSDESGD